MSATLDDKITAAMGLQLQLLQSSADLREQHIRLSKIMQGIDRVTQKRPEQFEQYLDNSCLLVAQCIRIQRKATLALQAAIDGFEKGLQDAKLV